MCKGMTWKGVSGIPIFLLWFPLLPLARQILDDGSILQRNSPMFVVQLLHVLYVVFHVSRYSQECGIELGSSLLRRCFSLKSDLSTSKCVPPVLDAFSKVFLIIPWMVVLASARSVLAFKRCCLTRMSILQEVHQSVEWGHK